MLQISQLRCFVAVASELHFARAAASLHMTQPPLTRQIQLLEHEIGVSLLDRNRRHVRLTPAGKTFFKEAQDILRRVQSATLSARRTVEGTVGQVRAGFIPAASYSLLPRLVGAAGRALPGVDLSVMEMQTFDQLEALSAGRLDLGIVRPLYHRPDLQVACVLREPFVLAVPQAHPLARARKFSVKDLNGQATIMYSPADGQYMYQVLTGWLRGNSVQPDFVHSIGHTHSMLSLVDAGLGIALVPHSAQRMRFAKIRFRELPPDTAPFAELHLAWRSETANPAADQLRELLLKGS
ncbi:LysR family transcriptional regulator [Variovorax sp. J31P207]|uniref:LysR family transcriptional regulator n=1 Tax=Variovorax sp. J31P207 TaxID=3053510 RepID=UPI00257812C4|nr:LysR family transcriptional regulator [Variovorax sp. J31P207]MDM0071558.1 LysR family transcriptional regulator [Variovorax sp. J31P207]